MRHAALLIPMLGLVACLSGDRAPSSSAAPSLRAASAPPPASASSRADEAPLPRSVVAIDPSTLRDPFENLMSKSPPPPPLTRDAIFAATPVNDLRVRGTVTASGAGYAIIADEKGATEIVHEGRLIGAPRTIGESGSVAQWRVDRVRSGEVVLIEEGANTTRAPRTFVLRSGSPKA